MGRTLHNREADCVYGAALTTDQYSCVFCNAAGLRNAEDEDEKKKINFLCVPCIYIPLYERCWLQGGYKSYTKIFVGFILEFIAGRQERD